MKKLALLIALALSCVSAHAQLTTITASSIVHDVSGDLLPTGYFQLTPVNSSGNPTAFTQCGGGQVLPIANYWQISNGQIINTTTSVVGATVPDTSCATPSGTGYQVCITTMQHQSLYCYGQAIHPTGSTWSFDTWSPTTPFSPSPATAIAYSGSAPTGACTAPSINYVGSSAIYGCVGNAWVLLLNASGGAITWEGTWSSTTTYSVGMGVSRTVSGVTSSYVALNTNINMAPESNPGHWQLLAQGTAGATGPTGATGPAGVAGANGAAATVAVGTVSTLSAGSSATVTNVGTTQAATLNFGLPQGAAGATGPTGPTGPQGPAGANGAAGATGPTGPGVPTATDTGQFVVSSAPGINWSAPTNFTVSPQGLLRQAIGVSSIAAAATIAPTNPVTYITGSGAITVMTPPTGCTTAGRDCKLELIASSGSTWTTATGGGSGGFASVSAPLPGQALLFSYDPTVALWYPSGGGIGAPPGNGVPYWSGGAWGASLSVDGTGNLVSESILTDGYCPLAGCAYTGGITVGGSGTGIAGKGTDTIIAGATAQIGTGGSGGLATGSICDSYSCTAVLNTGTGTLATGTVLSITLAAGRSASPNCPWQFWATTGTTPPVINEVVSDAAGTITVTFASLVALQASTTYMATLVCGGV